jgi:hypothetical protein
VSWKAVIRALNVLTIFAKPERAKTMRNPYLGKSVVPVDARGASCAELFARIIQLEKRGVVVGDKTAGAVMEAKPYEERTETVAFYGRRLRMGSDHGGRKISGACGCDPG